MRALMTIAILFAWACSARPPTPTTPASPTVTGSINGQPFVAQSALMTEVNATARTAADGKSVAVSTIYVFERAVTCAEIAKVEDRHRLKLADKEHGIQIDIIGPWPRPRAILATEKDVDVAVQTGESRTDVQGTVTIVEATGWSGAISLDLKNPHSSDGARGDVSFTVCR